MKQLIFTLIIIHSLQSVFANTSGTSSSTPASLTETESLSPESMQMSVETFLTLTPKKYRQMTGKKLGIKNTLKLKAAQKVLRKKFGKKEADISKGVYILLAILGLAWLAMGLMTDFSGNDWIVNLVLTILCWLPGVIHAFVKMKDYY